MSTYQATPNGVTTTHRGIIYTVTNSSAGWTVQTCKLNSQVPGAIRRYTNLTRMADTVTALRGLPDYLAQKIYH